MRIFYVCGYGKGVTGGVQTVVPEYIRNMSKVSEVNVLSLGGKIFDAENVIYNEEAFFKKTDMIDLVIFHEVYYIKFFYIAEKLYNKNIPYIVIPHGSLTSGAQTQKKWIKKLFNILWVDKFIRRAAAIQFLSETEYQNSSQFETAPIIIPNGIRLNDNKPHKVYYDSEFGMKLVFIGRLSIFYKGLDLLLEACGKIKEIMRENGISLDIYGTDFEDGRKKLEDLAKSYGIEQIVHIQDGVFGEEKEHTLLEHDVFIQTSRSEGQPMGILESMEYGMPLIVTPGTTFAGIVDSKDCGWCVKENADSIADGIMCAYRDKRLWAGKGMRAALVLKEKYSWEVVSQMTIQEYEKYAK
jgi:glycosyltransferase involved in cell wall biosynthesis